MNKQYTAVIDTTSYLGNALNYLGGPDDNQIKIKTNKCYVLGMIQRVWKCK